MPLSVVSSAGLLGFGGAKICPAASRLVARVSWGGIAGVCVPCGTWAGEAPEAT